MYIEINSHSVAALFLIGERKVRATQSAILPNGKGLEESYRQCRRKYTALFRRGKGENAR